MPPLLVDTQTSVDLSSNFPLRACAPANLFPHLLERFWTLLEYLPCLSRGLNSPEMTDALANDKGARRRCQELDDALASLGLTFQVPNVEYHAQLHKVEAAMGLGGLDLRVVAVEDVSDDEFALEGLSIAKEVVG